MPAPELVIANSAYKKYPGGIIVLKAAEWLASARGTLSTEIDTRSCCGTVVRDTQTVTANVYNTAIGSSSAAFQEADDTLVIDFSTLPVEIGMRYIILVSALIEGDWDTTNASTFKTSNQGSFFGACDLRWYGDSTEFTSDSDTDGLVFKPRLIDTYRILGFGGNWNIGTVVGDEVLHWRAYAQSGTTCEWLLDQIYFIPAANFFGTLAGEWTNEDLEIIAGSQATFSAHFALDPDDGPPSWEDGSDGGDDYGKFTWHPFSSQGGQEDPTGVSEGDGGGDYQRKSSETDAEYMARVTPDDQRFLLNSTKIYPNDEPSASHCYGIHGAFYIPIQDPWMDDSFSRTIGDGNFAGADNHFVGGNWGTGPQGFGWWCSGTAGPTTVSGQRRGKAMWVDGSTANMEIRRVGATLEGQMVAGVHSFYSGSNPNAAQIFADNHTVSGRITWERLAAFNVGAGENASVRIETGESSSPTFRHAVYFNVNLVDGTWQFKWINTVLASGTLPSWGSGTEFGFKIEVKRHLLRARIWNATTDGEPGTWDYEDFRPLLGATGEFDPDTPYPYNDNIEQSIKESDQQTLAIIFGAFPPAAPNFARIKVDAIKVQYNPDGNNEQTSFSMEQPEGTVVGEIDIDSGSQHLVYWGTRDWTTFDEDNGGSVIDFSSKAWNHPDAAMLQRAESIWWWFRSVHGGPIDLARIRFRAFGQVPEEDEEE